jgi:ornithine carbamoyltransferase
MEEIEWWIAMTKIQAKSGFHHLPNITALSAEEISKVIKLGIAMKKEPGKYADLLKSKTMAMWFEKPSLRTRVSFETGMTQLGGHAIYIDTSTTHTKAKLEDEMKCLSGYVDIVVARVFSQETITKMMGVSSVPVINALSDKYHPCQALADMMTLYEIFPDPTKITIAYVGDGNNVCNSLIAAAKKLGIKINVSTPESLKPLEKPDLWTADPKEAVKGADLVYTDTWVSMGFEAKKDELITKLKPYQVNKALIGEKYFMHCLPAIRGQEVSDEVLDSKKSLVYIQANNRLHAQKALVALMLGAAK